MHFYPLRCSSSQEEGEHTDSDEAAMANPRCTSQGAVEDVRVF